jgi:hypothetical protein
VRLRIDDGSRTTAGVRGKFRGTGSLHGTWNYAAEHQLQLAASRTVLKEQYRCSGWLSAATRSKMKALIRGMGARSVEALQAAISSVLDQVSEDDIRGWFRHCGTPTAQTDPETALRPAQKSR